jgi:4-hydroxyacetophenone monooxygenase
MVIIAFIVIKGGAAVEPTSAVPCEDELRRILGQANPSVLRMALYQLTDDPELEAMPVNKVPLRGGAFVGYVVDESCVPTLVDKAIAYLQGPSAELPLPSPEKLRHMMEMLTGDQVTDREFKFGLEELALAEFPREAVWSGRKPSVPDDFLVVVIGAGASGLAAAIQFERLGIPYRLIERQSEIGGTWHRNRYPDARVDTSSFLYQFKFVKNYPWPEYFASQAEVKKYLEYVARTFCVDGNITFNAELTEAVWDSSTSRWNMVVEHSIGTTERLSANVIVSAAGQFSTPKEPDWAGREKYKGQIFHTTDWNWEFDVKGKRIAVVGNGSTGVQVMPKIAETAEHVYSFQRTPQWISPMENYRELITPEIRWIFDNVPYYWNWYCYLMQTISSSMQAAQEYDPEWQASGGVISERNDAMRETLEKYIQAKVGRVPGLADKVTPSYAPLARRLVVDNGFYDALLRDNVTLVTDGIASLEPEGIRTSIGKKIEVDAIVMASGFSVQSYLWPTEYVGVGGQRIADFWEADGPRAYLGLTMPGFPNLFMFYGPNSQARAGAFLTWIEVWARYAAQAVVHLLETKSSAMDVRPEIFQAYNDELDRVTQELIWEKEAPANRNYYVNRHGRQNVNIPFRLDHYFEMVANWKASDYVIS